MQRQKQKGGGKAKGLFKIKNSKETVALRTNADWHQTELQKMSCGGQRPRFLL